MDNFQFHSTTKIIFGKDTESQVGNETAEYGKKVLLHYGGGSIKRSGLYDRVIASLKAADIDIVELGGVQPNPRLSLVREGIEICRSEDIDIVLAVGGGSVIDSAKAIAFGTPSAKDVWEEFFIKLTPVTEALPLGTILTLPAAGSEASSHTVISNTETERKLPAHGQAMLPVFSILNPELTMTLPDYQTTCGISDMFAHILERYCTPTPNVDFTDHLCEGAMRSIIKNSTKVLAEPNNYDHRSELMLAGMIAHNDVLGLGRAGDWVTHDLEHELSAIWDVTHGEGLACLFPSYIQHVAETDIPRFTRLAEEVFGITDGNDQEKIEAAVRAMKEWFGSIGLATSLSQLDGFDADKIDLMAERCAEVTGGGIANLDAAGLAKVYRLAVGG